MGNAIDMRGNVMNNNSSANGKIEYSNISGTSLCTDHSNDSPCFNSWLLMAMEWCEKYHQDIGENNYLCQLLLKTGFNPTPKRKNEFLKFFATRFLIFLNISAGILLIRQIVLSLMK